MARSYLVPRVKVTYEYQAYITPSRLADEAVGPKRKRQHTERYVKAVEDGELDESQHAKIGRH